MTDTARLTTALAGRYAIERELGAGGMATVYLARDLKHDRQVALKVLRSDLAQSLGAERFVREIRLAARLTHPHILPLFDSGEADEFLYYVMPLVEGESLRDRLRKTKQLGVEEAVQLAREVADALDYAHRHDIVHRDIKPENILIHEGHALIADFGIGKAVTAAAGPDTVTQTGVAVGTPAYMSPEQAAGEGAIDGRSDLYSLGCVLYEMLTGAQPFTGLTAQAVIAKRFTQTPPEVTEKQPAVPRGLSRAVARLLAPAPADRYATGAQLLDALKSGEPIAPPENEKSIAVLPFVNMSADPDNEYFSDGITEEIINALSRLETLHVASRTSSFTFKGQGQDLRAVSAKLRANHILEGSVRRAGPRVRISVQLVDVEREVTLWSERYDRQIDDIFAVQDEIATTIAGRLQVTLGGGLPTSLVTAGTTNIEAYEEYLKGRHFWNQRGPALANAAPHFRRAVELDPAFAAPYAGLADSYGLYGLYGLVPPGDAWRKAREAAERGLELDPDDADVQFAAGVTDYWFGWDLDRAEQRFRAAIRINPRHARSWAFLAQLYGLLGRTDRLRELAPRAHAADPLSPLINALIASGFVFANQFEDALHWADVALEVDPQHAVAQYCRGLSLSAQGRGTDAINACERGVASHPSGLSLSALGTVNAYAGNRSAAEGVLARMNTIAHPQQLETPILVGLGRVEEAVEAACIAIRERHWVGWNGGFLMRSEVVAEHPRWQAAMKEVGLAWVAEARVQYNATMRV